MEDTLQKLHGMEQIIYFNWKSMWYTLNFSLFYFILLCYIINNFHYKKLLTLIPNPFSGDSVVALSGDKMRVAVPQQIK